MDASAPATSLALRCGIAGMAAAAAARCVTFAGVTAAAGRRGVTFARMGPTAGLRPAIGGMRVAGCSMRVAIAGLGSILAGVCVPGRKRGVFTLLLRVRFLRRRGLRFSATAAFRRDTAADLQVLQKRPQPLPPGQRADD